MNTLALAIGLSAGVGALAIAEIAAYLDGGRTIVGMIVRRL